MLRVCFSSMLLLAFLVSQVPAADAPDITVSKETTYVTEPKTEAGFVDLIAAINLEMSKDVAPEENAASIYFPVLGPKPDGTQLSDQFYAELGVPVPEEGGEYFITYGDYLKSLGVDRTADNFHDLLEQQSRAQQHPWNPQESVEVAGWLQANEEQLATVIKGAQLPKYYCPINADKNEETVSQGIIAVLLPHIQITRDVARALSCRALMQSAERTDAERWQDIVTLFRLGRHIGQGPFLIDGLVGIAIESIAQQTALIFIEISQPNAVLVAQYQQDLANLPARKPMAETLNLSERLMFVDIVATIAAGEGEDFLDIEDGLTQLNGLIHKSHLEIDWDLVLRNANGWYDRMVAAMQLKTHSERLAEFKEIDAELGKAANQFRKPNLWKTFGFALLDVETRSKMVGDILTSLLLPASKQVSKAETRIAQKHDNLRMALALQAYHSEHASYPESLKKLQPKYLNEIPADHLNEKPLTYMKKENGYLLYSVGDNQQDDGGKSYDEKKDDLVVKIPSLES